MSDVYYFDINLFLKRETEKLKEHIQFFKEENKNYFNTTYKKQKAFVDI